MPRWNGLGYGRTVDDAVDRRAANDRVQAKPYCHSPALTLRALGEALSGRRRGRTSLSMKLALAVKDEYQRRGRKSAYPEKRSQRPPGRPGARMATRIESV